MARYIDADKLLEKAEEIEWFNEGTGFYDHINIVHEYDVETAPTADVVPKSEVESTLDGLMKEAREIANRYEKSANETSDYDYARIEYRGCQMGALLVLFKIAELKKKYTEEKK